MELSLFALLLASFALTHSHPKHFDVIPKDYYKRQILQPIPGYIPVYIKTDEEPAVRSEIKNSFANGHPQQGHEHKEKASFKQMKIEQKNAEQDLDEIKSEGAVKESQNISGKPEISSIPASPSEKRDEVKP